MIQLFKNMIPIILVLVLLVVGIVLKNKIKERSEAEVPEQEQTRDKVLKSNDSEVLKQYLTEKYRLIQELIRIASDIVDLEELRKQKREDMYQFIYPKKAGELRQHLERYEELKSKAIDIKRKGGLSDEEKELCRMLEMENEDEELWRSLLEEEAGK